jgi:hypothetical protein
MGFFTWLGNGIGAVNNFFDSLYMRLPSSVRGLIWGFSMFVSFWSIVYYKLMDPLYKLIDFLVGWVFGGK